jgi:outer membrane protein assembly factor BamB
LKSKLKRLLLFAVLLATVLAATGCVSGLAPVGWSGGTLSDDKLYIGSEEGRLVAVNLADESRQWSDPIRAASSPGLFGCSPMMGGGCGGGSAGVPIYGSPVVDGELVYIAGYNGKIYAYNIATLQPRWVYPREGYLPPIVGGIVEDGGRLYVGVSSGEIGGNEVEGRFYALDAVTGDPLWHFDTEDKIWSTPAVSDGAVYFGSFDNNFYALNAAEGSLKWQFPTEGSIIATPLVEGGTVYIGSFDRYLYALDAAGGALKWKFQGENWFWARPVIVNGSLYAGCLDGNIYVLDADNLSEITRFDVENGISSDPVMIDGDIIFATRKGEIYSVATASNEVEFLVNLDEEVYGPLTAVDEVVYIHLQDMTLQRVNASNGALLRPISLKIAE